MKKIVLQLLPMVLLVLSFQLAVADQEVNLPIIKKQLNQSVQQQMKQIPAWNNFKQMNPTWHVMFDEQIAMPQRAFGTPISSGISGDLETQARHFIQANFSDLGIQDENLSLLEIRGTKLDIVVFEQRYNNIPVWGSNIVVSFNQDGLINQFALRYFPIEDLNTTPSVSLSELNEKASIGITSTITDSSIEDELIIAPIVSGNEYSYQVAYVVNVATTDGMVQNGDFHTMVDIQTGEVIYRQNEVKSCFNHVESLHNDRMMLAGTIEVEGEMSDNLVTPLQTRLLPYIEVNVDGTDYYADENGLIDIPSLNGPTTGTISLRSDYFITNRDGGANVPPIVANIDAGGNLINVDGDFRLTEISTYYHANKVRDFFYEQTGRTDLFNSGTYTLNVDVPQNCNATYGGHTINMFHEGGGCAATSLMADVIYHEFGHGINFDWLSPFSNGALGEGYGDVWAMMLTEGPFLAQNWQGPGTQIRRYDIDPKIFPQDLVGQVHADGEIIAGCWWDLYKELGDDMPTMRAIYVEASENNLASFTTPQGQEGGMYGDILVDALIADDDNGNLLDGTPHQTEILTAFAIHGITLLAGADVSHDEKLSNLENSAILLQVEIVTAFPEFLGNSSVYYSTDNGDTYNSVPLDFSFGSTYTATVPGQPAGTLVDYYIEIKDVNDFVAFTLPGGADQSIDPNIPYTTMVEFERQELDDFFDNNFGIGDWITDANGTDDATTGMWEVAELNASTATEAQPGEDFSPSADGVALVTGADTGGSLGGNDVDGGCTTVQSPSFDMTSFTNPTIAYRRWFSNRTGSQAGTDSMKVEISNNGGTFWTILEHTPRDDASWRRHVLTVEDFVTTTNQMMLRFTACDRVSNQGSLVEMAVDEIELWDSSTPTVGIDDLNDVLSFQIAPNPVSDELTISVSGFETTTNYELSIYSLTGQEVYRANASSGSNQHVVDVKSLASGTYILKAQGEQFNLTKKFTVTE